MFKKGMLRPNYMDLTTAVSKNLGPEAFYPPLNDMGKEWLNDLKIRHKELEAHRNGKPIFYDLPDEDFVKYNLYTDAELEPPYRKAECKGDSSHA